LKKDAAPEPVICGRLQFEPAKGIKHLQFLLLEYHFFRGSEGGSALLLDLPWLLSPLSLMVHIVKSRAIILLVIPCYFAKLDTRIVGLMAIQGSHEGLLVASLGVAKEHRRLGIGTCILRYVEVIAGLMGKKWLEVDVLRKNIPALQFYTKYGFTFVQSERTRYIVRGRKLLNH
jgi:ribosomal protein S18 acetylase RimI-like enzyme